MRSLLIGVALLALASAAPASAWQPAEEYPEEETEPAEPGTSPRGDGPRSDRPRSDRPMPGGRCRSEADEKATAEEFCEDQLKCDASGKTIKCDGNPGRWICKCV